MTRSISPSPLTQPRLPSQRTANPARPVLISRPNPSVRNFRSRSKRRAISVARHRRTRSITLSHSSLTTGRDFSMADLTIDLATLDVTKNAPKLLQEPDLESLGSEDEGPPDFTLNMEKWMRGTEKWKKEGGQVEDDRNDEEGQVSDGKESAGGESLQEEKKQDMEDLEEESEFLPLGASTPVPQFVSKKNVPEPSHTSNARNVAHRPPSGLNTETEQNTTSDDVTGQICDLQARIEQLQMENGKHQLVKNSLQLENSTLRDEIDGLTDELSNMRSTVSKMRQQVKATDKERELERKSQEEAKSISVLQDKYEPLLQELAIARSTTEVEKRHSEAKIMALETKLLSTQESLMKQQIDFRYTQEVKNNENLKLRSELDICKGEIKAYLQTLQAREEDHIAAVAVLHKKLDAGHEVQSKADVLKMELDHALEQLAETRRTVEIIENENDRLTQANERQRDELNATTTVLSEKDATITAAKSVIENLKDEIGRIKGGKSIGLIEEDVHDAEIKQLRQQHRAESIAAQIAHERKEKELSAKISRARDGMRKQEARLQKTHREELASLNQEIATLKSRLKAPVGPHGGTIDEHRNAIRMLAHKLNAANETILSTRHSLAEAHKSLAVSTSNVERLSKECEEYKTAVKDHYRGRLQKVDQDWEKKMDAVLKDRGVIVKHLYRAGILPDGYQFFFVDENGDRIPQPGELDKNGKLIPFPGETVKNQERVPQPVEKGKTAKRIEQSGERGKMAEPSQQYGEKGGYARVIELIRQSADKGKNAELIPLPSGKEKKNERTVRIAEKDTVIGDVQAPSIAEKHQSKAPTHPAPQNHPTTQPPIPPPAITTASASASASTAATSSAPNARLLRQILDKYHPQHPQHQDPAHPSPPLSPRRIAKNAKAVQGIMAREVASKKQQQQQQQELNEFNDFNKFTDRIDLELKRRKEGEERLWADVAAIQEEFDQMMREFKAISAKADIEYEKFESEVGGEECLR